MDSDDEGAMEDDDLEDIATSDLAVGMVPDLSIPTTEARIQLPMTGKNRKWQRPFLGERPFCCLCE
jgi:hypothetical protein